MHGWVGMYLVQGSGSVWCGRAALRGMVSGLPAMFAALLEHVESVFPVLISAELGLIFIISYIIPILEVRQSTD